MTFVLKPKTHHPKLPLNDLGLTRRDYEGQSLLFVQVVAMTQSVLPSYRLVLSSLFLRIDLRKFQGLDVHQRLQAIF